MSVDLYHPPRVPVTSRLSLVTMDRGVVGVSGHALLWTRPDGTIEVPVAMTSVVMLEPGVSITHAAVKLCADHGTLLLWVGEAGVRVYSAGDPGGKSGVRILRQAELRLRDSGRLAVARRLYARMFVDPMPAGADVDALRGAEGARVKQWYAEIAARRGVAWSGRESAPERLQSAIGYATATLYGLCEAVILAAGYSPAIGFIHTGDSRSLVFDLADTVKFRTVVPVAFDVYASGSADVRSAVRRACRDLFRQERLLAVLLENLMFALGTES